MSVSEESSGIDLVEERSKEAQEMIDRLESEVEMSDRVNTRVKEAGVALSDESVEAVSGDSTLGEQYETEREGDVLYIKGEDGDFYGAQKRITDCGAWLEVWKDPSGEQYFD